MGRQEEIDRQRRLLQQTLKRVGYTGARNVGKRSLRPGFPDLSTAKPNLSPTSTMADAQRGRGSVSNKPVAAVPDGFVIGNPHKQGLQLMPASELPWAGGKKA